MLMELLTHMCMEFILLGMQVLVLIMLLALPEISFGRSALAFAFPDLIIMCSWFWATCQWMKNSGCNPGC